MVGEDTHRPDRHAGQHRGDGDRRLQRPLLSRGTGHYTYVWTTSRSWAGTSRQLVVKFKDGTKDVANFRFK